MIYTGRITAAVSSQKESVKGWIRLQQNLNKYKNINIAWNACTYYDNIFGYI